MRSSLGVWRYKERILTRLRGHYVRRSSRSSASATSSFSTAAVSGDLALRKPSRSHRRKKRNQTSSASSSSWVRSLGLGGNIPTQWMLKRQDAFHRPAHTRAAASDHRQAASNSRALLPAGSRHHRQESNRGTGTARRGVRGTSGGTTRADGRTGRAGITPLASHPRSVKTLDHHHGGAPGIMPARASGQVRDKFQRSGGAA